MNIPTTPIEVADTTPIDIPTPSRRPRTDAPFPFSTVEYARLLILRGRVQDGLVGHDDRHTPMLAAAGLYLID